MQVGKYLALSVFGGRAAAEAPVHYSSSSRAAGELHLGAFWGGGNAQ